MMPASPPCDRFRDRSPSRGFRSRGSPMAVTSLVAHRAIVRVHFSNSSASAAARRPAARTSASTSPSSSSCSCGASVEPASRAARHRAIHADGNSPLLAAPVKSAANSGQQSETLALVDHFGRCVASVPRVGSHLRPASASFSVRLRATSATALCWAEVVACRAAVSSVSPIQQKHGGLSNCHRSRRKRRPCFSAGGAGVVDDALWVMTMIPHAVRDGWLRVEQETCHPRPRGTRSNNMQANLLRRISSNPFAYLLLTLIALDAAEVRPT